MKRLCLSVLAVSALFGPMRGAGLFDCSSPEDFIGLSFRAGINETSVSNNLVKTCDDVKWTTTNWGTGFTLGAVADIRIKNFFSIQPGVFFQSRNMKYSYTFDSPLGELQLPATEMEEGSMRSYDVQFPLMFVGNLNLAPNLKGHLEAGVYIQSSFGGRVKATVYKLGVPEEGAATQRYTVAENRKLYGDQGFMRRSDWGFKMGVGFTFARRYYLGVHYEAGVRNPYKYDSKAPGTSGRNKAWDFTLGYSLF